jgi:RNA polymerase sigma-70 factor (ECF subfamily)
MTTSVAERPSDLETLFRLHEAAIGRFLVGMVGDVPLAEDLLQETFLEAIRAPTRVALAESQEAWLFGVARHRALSALRGRQRLLAALGRLARREVWTASDLPPDVRGVVELLSCLAPDDRALVLLRYVHGFDAPELARLTGRSPAAIRKRLERARASLAERLGPEAQP